MERQANHRLNAFVAIFFFIRLKTTETLQSNRYVTSCFEL